MSMPVMLLLTATDCPERAWLIEQEVPELPFVVPFGGSVPQIQPKSITNPKKELEMGV